MKRWLPFPFTSAALWATWLLLNQSIGAGHLLLGAILAVALPVLTRSLQPLAEPRIKKPATLLRLLTMSFIEIVRSCFNVARIILFVQSKNARSGFVRIPLDLRNPYGLALLSCLINITPGTVWVEILQEKHELVLHVFDLHDELWWIDTIKTRYEKPLIEIFD